MTTLFTDEDYAAFNAIRNKFVNYASCCKQECEQDKPCPLDDNGYCLAETFDELDYTLSFMVED